MCKNVCDTIWYGVHLFVQNQIFHENENEKITEVYLMESWNETLEAEGQTVYVGTPMLSLMSASASTFTSDRILAPHHLIARPPSRCNDTLPMLLLTVTVRGIEIERFSKTLPTRFGLQLPRCLASFRRACQHSHVARF